MDDYLVLIKKYLENQISISEKERLQKWISEKLENKVLFKAEVKDWYTSQDSLQTDPISAYSNFINLIDQKETKVILLKPWLKVAVCAAVLVGILFGSYYSISSNFLVRNSHKVVATDTTPLDKIKITQGNGTVTYMSFDDTSDIINANGKLIGKKNEDELIISGGTDMKMEYMDISIPKGELFQLTLSDGSKVLLNSASTLKFPQHFAVSEKNRVVYLEGEAFFDVTTNTKQPFIVKTGTIDIEVLGTQFNVSSYSDDAMVKTTLVEGAVKVKNLNDPTSSLSLTPSYQAVYNKDAMILDKKKVNTVLFTSWMNRKIIIQDESFAELHKRIERSYDVEIISQNKKLNTTRFTGEFDLENVRQILNVLAETIDFTYEMNQNKILIHPSD